MLSCKETVLILSSDKELSFRQRIELRFHLLMCKHCASYSKQIGAIVGELKRMYRETTKIDVSRVAYLENQIIEKMKKFKSKD
ncbi:MAG: hypothetical protein A2622_09590 [Bdellovibrionales bacterium RIFCSPHIGHO2_01_FULL_40_29]|nr:MAG: hypothetical protein A2622_09590 [Bdellovibrionales bacterium RIFCSPHIGHO2_01_FULL_40_29]OFZ33526.1 MAG: hypothetical protein A3D17_00030 [Bdellovibrionales bacterium RIFCSPHIGHO2_02_FULL_40_15]